MLNRFGWQRGCVNASTKIAAHHFAAVKIRDDAQQSQRQGRSRGAENCGGQIFGLWRNYSKRRRWENIVGIAIASNIRENSGRLTRSQINCLK